MDIETIEKIIEMQTVINMMTMYMLQNGYMEGYMSWSNDMCVGAGTLVAKQKKVSEAN